MAASTFSLNSRSRRCRAAQGGALNSGLSPEQVVRNWHHGCAPPLRAISSTFSTNSCGMLRMFQLDAGEQESQLDGDYQYSLRVFNNSSNTGDTCVYQQDPDLGVANAMPLAWMAKRGHPQTTIVFRWCVLYDFVWSESGLLAPGAVVDASQTFEADLQNANQITLTFTDGAYTFINQMKGPQPGKLYVLQDQSIPLRQACVGIGMSGLGTFVVQAQPNIGLTFTPHPRYYLTFGEYQQGEVLEPSTINNPVEIQYPANIYSMTAILNPDNSWTVMTTTSANHQANL